VKTLGKARAANLWRDLEAVAGLSATE
jgi:hypothetical protein